MKKLTQAQIAPVRAKLLAEQGHRCPLCYGSMKGAKGKKPALDHDHITGAIRDVLCLNCNGMEGKIFNLARRGLKGDPQLFVERLLEYWIVHKHAPRPYTHPTHKTANEKRLATNAKARKKRAAAKKA
tara:strand:+ start:1692 stop:2075 length:384 start_codon:yes stop_codon:yes gene_type:complete